MRKIVSLIATAAMVALLPAAALATQPNKLPVSEFDIFFEEPVATAECGFPVFVHEFGTERVTEFFDKNGDLTHVTIHVNGRAEVLDGEDNLLAWENFAFNVFLDFENGTATLNGNVFNVHITGEGIVINDSGQIIFSLADGSLIAVHGPHEAFFTPPGVLICEALNS